MINIAHIYNKQIQKMLNVDFFIYQCGSDIVIEIFIKYNRSRIEDYMINIANMYKYTKR
jgi:hypothetical protein